MTNEPTAPSGYVGFLSEVTSQIRQHQYHALRAANKELLALYFHRSHAPAWECIRGRSSVPTTRRWSGWGYTPTLERGSDGKLELGN